MAINLEKSYYSRLAPEDKAELEKGYIVGLLNILDDPDDHTLDLSNVTYETPIIDRAHLIEFLQSVYNDMGNAGLTLDNLIEKTSVENVGEYIAYAAEYGQEMLLDAPFTEKVKNTMLAVLDKYMGHPAIYQMENGELVSNEFYRYRRVYG